ncbi:hypothetical protein Hanom_Chr06g00550491 [Helianthus anomalus]
MKNKKVFINCDYVFGDNMKIQISGLFFSGSGFKSQLTRFQPNNSPPKICRSNFKEAAPLRLRLIQ